MAYDLTPLNGTNATIVDFIDLVNDASGSTLIGGLVIATFSVQMIGLSKFGLDYAQSGTMSAFACLIYTTLLWMGGFLVFYFPAVFLLIASFGAMYLYFQGR